MSTGKRIKKLETEYFIQNKILLSGLCEAHRTKVAEKIKLIKDELVRLKANVFVSDKMIK